MYLQPSETIPMGKEKIVITKIWLYKDNGCFVKWIDVTSQILLDLIEAQKIKISNDDDF